ncbi:hypothetical protein OA496_02440 [Pelagibacteraceae bacterium]|nr:hypothetical protein [Pelagibacteraceae bacterium]
MNSIQKKIVAGIGIYEVVLITFVLVFEPYGSRMSSREWENFWIWSLLLPAAAIVILYLINWGFGANLQIFKLKKNNKKYKFDLKKLMVDFYNGKLSLPLSFWVFGFLGSVIIGGVSFFIIQNMLIGRLLNLPWQIFTIIGIWGSADNYKGLKIFPILAKIFTIIWLINNVGGIILML